MKRTTALNTINDMPKEFELEELLERLIVIEKIDEGLKDIKEGKIVRHDEAKKKIAKWLK